MRKVNIETLSELISFRRIKLTILFFFQNSQNTLWKKLFGPQNTFVYIYVNPWLAHENENMKKKNCKCVIVKLLRIMFVY